MYTVASALTLASIFALVRWLDTRRLWIILAHVTLSYLAFLTTPTVMFGLFLAGGMAGIFLLYRREWAAALVTLTAYVLLVAAWWPLKRHARMAVNTGSLDWIPRPPGSALFSLHGEMLTGGLGAVRGIEPSPVFQGVVSLLVLGLVAVAVVARWRREPTARCVTLVANWLYIIAISAYATSVLKRPVWVLRYFHYTAPALYLLLGIGIVSLRRWSRTSAYVAGGGLFLLLACATMDYYRLPMHEDWRGAAAAVQKEAAPGDIVGVVGLAGLFADYYQGDGTVLGIWPADVAPYLAKMPRDTATVLCQLLREIPSHDGRTWIVIREDPRFERVDFLKAFERYLRNRAMIPRTRIFRTIQGQIDVIDFQSSFRESSPPCG